MSCDQCEIYRPDFNFCPHCGTPLTPPQPLTLEELRGMDGKAVYVKVTDSLSIADSRDQINGWGLVRKSWVRLWDSGGADLIHIDHDFSDYGETWLAYPAEPGREDSEKCVG